MDFKELPEDAMTHMEKVGVLVKELEAQGVSKFTTAPPLYRLAWRIGLKVRPPHFQGSVNLFLSTWATSAVTIVFFMYLFESGTLRDPFGALISASCGGAIIGVSITHNYRTKARLAHLKDWESYPNA